MNDVAQKIAVSAGSLVAVAVLGFAWKRWGVPSWRFLKRLSNLLDDVNFIKKEFQSNGGGSLKDRIADITKRMTDISNSLSILEARQRGLIASLPRPTFEADADLNWTEVNRAMERLTGLGFAQLSRKRWYFIIHDDDRDAVATAIQHALRDKRDVGISFRIVTDNGEIGVRLDAKPTFDRQDGNSIICWTGWIQNEEDRRVEERRHP